MGMSKITRNYQITLPKYIRELGNLKEGDNIMFTIEQDGIKLSKSNENAVSAAAGIWNIKETGVEYKKRIREEWAKREKRWLK